MLLVGIDTCGASGSVALARLEPISTRSEELTLLAQTELPGKTYSARLVPAIRDLLTSHEVAVADLNAIVVTSGPGSFTGIRIGLSTAKGLAEPTSIPILAVSRLAILAHQAGKATAALDASRGELYFGDFSNPAPQESLLTREQFTERATRHVHALAICEPALLTVVPHATLVPQPTAVDAIRFALPRLRARNFDDPLLLDGNYLRRSDAEIFAQPGAPSRPKPAPRS